MGILREAQKIAPESAEVSFLYAVGSTEMGEIDAALAAYADAEKRGPTALLFLRRAVLYRRLGENERALADLRQALSRELPARKVAEAHLLAGSILAERRLWSEAEPHVRQAIDLAPDNSSAHLLLAETLLGLGRASAAAECRRNLEENPMDSPARLLRAQALLEQRLDKDAADEINRASEFEGETGAVLLARGKLAAAQGLTQMAIDYLDRVGKTDPSLVEAFYFLGMRLLKSSRRSDAAVAFEKATIVDPLHAQSWLELGKIYLSAKRAEAAVRYFQRATSAAPESAEAQYQLAIAFREMGRLLEAEDAAHKAKTLGHASADGLLQSLGVRAVPSRFYSVMRE
jgi:tetratricopeptide (TPR) repeat protein